MKLYDNVDVDFTYQNFGSVWLGILRGSTENIESVFNGLYNLCATGGEPKWQDHSHCIATFWTDYKGMRRFFFNRYFLPRTNQKRGEGCLIRAAMKFARHKMLQFPLLHEPFMDFRRDCDAVVYQNGRITAERPDVDMKDAILSHAFGHERNEKVVDNEQSI